MDFLFSKVIVDYGEVKDFFKHIGFQFPKNISINQE
jgi:hypothetical protein